MLDTTDHLAAPPPWPYAALDLPRTDNRAALYLMANTASQFSESNFADLKASAAAASKAGFRFVTMASDDIDNTVGAPMLCDLMERLGQGEFDAIYGRAQGRDVVIELEGIVRSGKPSPHGRGLQ